MKVLLVVSCLIIAIIFFLSCSFGDNEIYILPKHFVGAVYVIFNQNNGQPKKYEGGKRYYQIPKEGILRTQFSFNNGWHQTPKCFYENGTRVEIPFKLIAKNVSGNMVQACCLSSGSAYKVINGNPVPFEVFYVGSEMEIDSAFKNQEKVDLTKYIE